MISRLATLTIIVAILVVATACVGNRMYRIESVETAPNYTLSYVEFDDGGEMWAPSQLERAVEQIQRANETNDGCVFVLFIHGWMHNASQKEEEGKESNIAGFKQMLDTIGKFVAATEGKQAPVVVAVGVTIPGMPAVEQAPALIHVVGDRQKVTVAPCKSLPDHAITRRHCRTS